MQKALKSSSCDVTDAKMTVELLNTSVASSLKSIISTLSFLTQQKTTALRDIRSSSVVADQKAEQQMEE